MLLRRGKSSWLTDANLADREFCLRGRLTGSYRLPGFNVLTRDNACRLPRTPFSASGIHPSPRSGLVSLAQSSCHRRSDGVPDHPGMPFGFPPERATFLPLTPQATQLLDPYLGRSTLAPAKLSKPADWPPFLSTRPLRSVRKLAVGAADNGLLAPELANGITRVKGVAAKSARLGTGSPPGTPRHY
jgi:hypothetical protein